MGEHAAIDVRHEAALQRFTTVVDGVQAALDYEQRGDVLCLTHTGVPSEIGGRGIAAELVRTALDYARSNGLKVVPACAYVAAYVERNSRYQDLLADNAGH